MTVTTVSYSTFYCWETIFNFHRIVLTPSRSRAFLDGRRHGQIPLTGIRTLELWLTGGGGRPGHYDVASNPVNDDSKMQSTVVVSPNSTDRSSTQKKKKTYPSNYLKRGFSPVFFRLSSTSRALSARSSRQHARITPVYADSGSFTAPSFDASEKIYSVPRTAVVNRSIGARRRGEHSLYYNTHAPKRHTWHVSWPRLRFRTPKHLSPQAKKQMKAPFFILLTSTYMILV